MDQADLTDEQCQRLREALAAHVAWLRRLHERMDRRRWCGDDPLYRQVLAARREVERLDELLLQISLVAGPRHPRARRVAPPQASPPPRLPR